MPGRSRILRYLVVAFCARLADEGMAVAVVLLSVDRTGSAAQGALVLTAWMAPHVLAAPLAGAAAARARRPRLFHAGAFGGFALAIAATALTLGRLPLPLVLALTAAGGCCGPVVSGGLSSLITRLLPAGPERDRAYSWDAVVYNAAAVAGPASAGLVASALSPATAVLVLSAAAGCACVLTPLLPLRAGADGPPRAPERLGRDLADGVWAVWRERELRAVTAATCLAFAGVGALTTTSVLLATGLGNAGAGGLLMTAFSVGALAGTLGITRLRRTVGPQLLAAGGLLGTGVGLAAAAAAPAVPVAAACFAAAGACDGLVLTATLRIRADHSPPRARTQVFTIGAGLKISAAAAGSALAALATVATAPWYLTGIAVLQAAAALVYVLVRRNGRRRAVTLRQVPLRTGRRRGRLPGFVCTHLAGTPDRFVLSASTEPERGRSRLSAEGRGSFWEPTPPTHGGNTAMSGQLYDGIGEAFEGFKTLPIIRYAEVPGFLALVGDVSGKSVLDVACGTGFYSRELKRRGASRVFGFDISGAMIDTANAIEQAEPLGVEYEVSDTASLRTFDQPFDVAVAVQAFNYASDVAEIEEMMRNIRRSLVSGGSFFLFMQNPDYDFGGPSLEKYGFLLESTGKDNEIGSGIRLTALLDPPVSFEATTPSKETFEQTLKAAGFTGIEWVRLEVSEAGLEKYGEEFWADYAANRPLTMLRCTA
ncbi:MFS transporter [Streptomyces sp. NPDC048352]|uniref:MFS transporter n=1 Tax=Streptomyces sp. NPDC048352 TaxID=3154718 RepID=UPI003423130A